MIVFLASQTFDISGHVKIETLPDNTIGETTRRLNRVSTLDGGVAINDGGFAEGDRTLSFEWRTVSKAHNESIDRMVKLYSLVHVSTPDGVFLAAPYTFTPGPDLSSVTLYVQDKVSA